MIGHLCREERRMRGSWERKMKKVQRLKGMDCISYVIGSQLKLMKWHESREHAFLQCMVLTSSIIIVEKTLECACLRCSTDYEENHSLRKDTGTLDQRGHNMNEWFKFERLQTLQGCETVLIENCVIEPIM